MSDFQSKYNELLLKLGDNKEMVLSTSRNDIVSSRMMSIIIFDGSFYFQTDKKLPKYEDIKYNFNVSLCVDNISIKGIINELGNPLNNKQFIELYKKHYLGSYNTYSHLSTECLFKVTPTDIKCWVYINSEPYIEKFDLKNKTYLLEKYNLER